MPLIKVDIAHRNNSSKNCCPNYYMQPWPAHKPLRQQSVRRLHQIVEEGSRTVSLVHPMCYLLPLWFCLLRYLALSSSAQRSIAPVLTSTIDPIPTTNPLITHGIVKTMCI